MYFNKKNQTLLPIFDLLEISLVRPSTLTNVFNSFKALFPIHTFDFMPDNINLFDTFADLSFHSISFLPISLSAHNTARCV